MDAAPFVESRLNCCATMFVDGAGIDSLGTPFCDECAIALPNPESFGLAQWLVSLLSLVFLRMYVVEALTMYASLMLSPRVRCIY